jgi:ATP-dependent Clp protease ATP-binding subunit ClpC
MVEPAPEGSEEEVKLSIVKPAAKPAPVAVGGRKEDEEAPPAEEPGALDQPPVPPADET